MNRSLIANRYAKALYKLAEEELSLDSVSEDMVLLQSYCKEVDGFTALLNNPLVKPGQKKKVLHSLLQGQVKTMTMNLIDLLLSNNREMLLEDINRSFISLYKADKGIKDVVIYSAVPFDPDHLQSVKGFLAKQFNAPVELTVKVRPELLGGFIFTVDGLMVDASMSTKLKQIKNELLN